MAAGEAICLVDGSGYIFRAFYALPPMTRPDGTPVNAVYGFVNMLTQLMQQNRCSHILVVLDAARQNFRNDIYPDYKATRRETPPDLIPQFPLIRQACDALNIPCIELNGYEADDIIATYARIAVEQGFEARVISADKDLMQLMRPGVALYDPMKKKTLTQEDVLKKFGVQSDKVVAVQSLMGDSTDNVPGAAGIGPKTAAELINTYGTLENIFAHIDEITPQKRKEGLIRDKEKIFISQKLVLLDNNAPVSPDLSAYAARVPDWDKLRAFLEENGFKSLIPKMEYKFHFDVDAAYQSVSPQSKPKEPVYTLINSRQSFLNLLEKNAANPMAVRLYTDSNNNVVGAALAFDEQNAYYVPLETNAVPEELDLFSYQTQPTPKIEGSLFISKLIERLTQGDKPLIWCGFKAQMHLIADQLPFNISFKNGQDISLASYVYKGLSINPELKEMAQSYLGVEKPLVADILGTGKAKKTFEELSLEQKAPVRAYEAHLIFRLHQFLTQALTQESESVQKVYTLMEMPLAEVLFRMERAGILIDKARLSELNTLFTQELDQLINLIYELGGEEFNINSPQQVGYILFEKLGLEGGKKNHSGGFSTDVKTLTDLAEKGIEIAEKILEYRQYAKLKSTYVDALTELADKNMRVHTTFLQTATNTGRLSSIDPNLQNIPIRTKAGREIRRAFIAKPGYKLVCADYSQIELRLMAHVAQVKQLQASFCNNEDIHTRTASQIFNVSPSQVDFDMRRNAKAINFGIIYGMSAFGLAAQLKISRTDAKKYIDAYFAHYPEIQNYMSQTVQFAEQNGYVETFFGRKCSIAQIKDPKMKNFAARAAINAPIQGAAADIIKLAMNAVQKKLSAAAIDACLLLQVHDELVFEVKESDVTTAIQLIKDTMENIVSISVPLTADVRAGNNWKEAH